MTQTFAEAVYAASRNVRPEDLDLDPARPQHDAGDGSWFRKLGPQLTVRARYVCDRDCWEVSAEDDLFLVSEERPGAFTLVAALDAATQLAANAVAGQGRAVRLWAPLVGAPKRPRQAA